MKQALRIIAVCALAGTILPSILFFAGRVSLDQSKSWLLVASVVWFAVAPLQGRVARDG